MKGKKCNKIKITTEQGSKQHCFTTQLETSMLFPDVQDRAAYTATR